jgi:hypothetical protein
VLVRKFRRGIPFLLIQLACFVRNPQTKAAIKQTVKAIEQSSARQRQKDRRAARNYDKHTDRWDSTPPRHSFEPPPPKPRTDTPWGPGDFISLNVSNARDEPDGTADGRRKDQVPRLSRIHLNL